MSRSTANLSTAAAAAIATAAPWVAKNYSEPHFVTMPSVEQYRSLHQVPDAPPSTSTFIDSRRNYQPTHSSTATTASFSAEKMQHQQQSHYEAPEAFYSGDILPLPSQGSNINSNNGSNTKAVHKKALTIHIDTPHVGPNGMPLVYGSSPEGPGKIKGRVRFAANYDCKGKDIQIIYEARAEASWSTIENKKMVHHHTREDFGHQTWTLPLKHTKEGGSTIVAGEYEKAFEVLLVPPSSFPHDSASAMSSSTSLNNSVTPTASRRHPRNASSVLYSLDTGSNRSTVYSAHGTPGSATATTAGIGREPMDTSGAARNAAASVLPSSSYGIHARMRYTIRAILQRPFPSSNVEASQEIWVLHTSLPSRKPSTSSSTKSQAFPTTPTSPSSFSSTSTAIMKLHNSGNGHGNGHYGSLRHQKDTTFTQSGAKDEEERTLSSKNRHGSQAKASQGDRPVTKGSEVVMEPNTATESSQGKIPAMSSSTTQDDAATANKDAATAGGGLGSMLTSVNVFRFIPTTLPAVDTIKKKIGTSIDRAEQLLMLSSSKLTSPSPTPALATQESSSTSSSDESTSKEADPQTATTAPTTTTSIASSATSSEKEDGNTTTSTMISTQQVSRSGDPRRHSMQPPSSSATPHAPRSPTMKTRELSIHRSASLPSTRGLRGQDLQGKGQRASTPTTTTSPMESTSSHRRDSKDKGRSHHPSREASHSQRHKEFRGSKKKKADIEYTGIWEVFQVPYCLTLPSETVHLGQKVPLKIRFGPFPWTTRPKGHLRSSSSSSSLSSLAYTDRDEHGRRAKHHHHRRRRRGTFSSTSDSDASSSDDGRVHSHEYLDGPRFHHHHHQQLQRPPRFRVTRGTLKLVEHIVLRKIDHIEVPQKLKQQQRTTGRHYHPQQASEQVFLQPSESLSSAASLPGSSSSSRHRQYASLANVGGGTRSTATPTLPLVQVTPSPSSVGRFSIRRLVGRKNSNQDTHTSSSISHLSASSPSTSPRPSEYMERLHEDHQRSGSSSQHQPHHLAVRSPAAGVASAAVSLPSSPISAHFPAGSTTTTNHSGGGGAGFRLWPKSSSSAGKKQKRQSLDQPLGRHSMDNSELAIGGRNASADALHRSGSGGSGSTTAKTGTNSTSGSGHTTKPMTTKVISQVEARFKTEVMSLPLDQFLAKDKALFIGEEGSKKRKMRVLKKDENSAFVKGDTPEEDGQDSDQEENDHSQQQAFWETTVWFTIPDPSKVSPYTQTTNIVKSHTLQLILGFALEVPPALPRDSNDSDEGDEGDDDLPLPLPTPLQHLVAHPGAVITKPFRLELDLYITGPPAPST